MKRRVQIRFRKVSILILLEVILEVLKHDLKIAEDESFNPYFTGSNSGSG